MKYIIPIIILSLVLLSCAKQDEEETDTTTDLEGTWVVSCYDDNDDGINYLIKTLTVTGTEWVDKIEIHTDSSCATDKDKWEFTWGSLQIGETGTHDGSPTAKFTMTLGTSKYTPQTSALVSSANTNSWCGESDWELNTAKDVAGKTCFSTAESPSGHPYYGLYILDGDKYMADASSSSYPDSVNSDTSNTYVKQ